MLSPHAAERAIATASALLRQTAYNQRLKYQPRLVYDEWNVWYRDMKGGSRSATPSPTRSLSGPT